MDLFMRTSHVYVPTTEQDRYHSPVSDRLFLISAVSAFEEVTAVLWMDVCGSIPGAKSAVVEFWLRAAHGEQGLGVWLCTWPLCMETLRRCSQVSMRPTHKSAAHAVPERRFPSPHMQSFDILICKSHEFAHLWFCLCAHTNTREAAVSPLCGETVIGDLRVFRGWVGGSDLT